jgi:hypothetical protein
VSALMRAAYHQRLRTVADCGELLVQLPDRLGVAPRLQVQPEPAHVLEVRRDLLGSASVSASAPMWHASSMLPSRTCAVARAESSRGLILTISGSSDPSDAQALWFPHDDQRVGGELRRGTAVAAR